MKRPTEDTYVNIIIYGTFADIATRNDTSLTRRHLSQTNDASANNDQSVFTPVDLDYGMARIRAESDQDAATGSSTSNSL